MNCENTDELLNAYVDGELDVMTESDLDKHLSTCKGCKDRTRALRLLRSSFAEGSLRFEAPDDLREKVRDAISSQPSAVSNQAGKQPPNYPLSSIRYPLSRWFPGLAIATVLLLVFAFMFFRSQPSTDDLVASELVSDHVRSMMVDHLSDVVSTDQHTVKPWFEGKLDYAPPVTDLASQGFPLTGGRLDYAAGRPIAALVYQRKLHAINLFVLPTTESDTPPRMSSRQGFNLVHWTRQGMTFYAVSDLNLDELQQFAVLLGAA
ncbi:MAG TPA: anti-sigma factor [Pyrinomonadaceae bacterium]|jgi:anti-sigma factor RsiW